MKKKTKLLSVVLALVLAISAFTVMSVAVNAAEEDDYWDISESTMDTPTESVVDHIELVNLPDKTEYIQDTDSNMSKYGISIGGLEFNVYFSDGTEKHIVCTENIDYYSEVLHIQCFDSEGKEVDWISEFGEYTVRVSYYIFKGDIYDYESDCEVCEYTINVIEDPFNSTVKSIEIIKLPNKVFTAPYISSEDCKSQQEYFDMLNDNSIQYNMNGAQLKINFTDGTSDVYNFDKPNGFGLVSFEYEGRYIYVTDLGSYKAEVEFAGKTTVFEVNHTGADSTVSDDKKADSTTGNPANGNLASSDTAKSSTSDTATSDSVKNGNADNGAIATGSVMYSVVAIIVLVSACGVLAFFNRKRYLSK